MEQFVMMHGGKNGPFCSRVNSICSFQSQLTPARNEWINQSFLDPPPKKPSVCFCSLVCFLCVLLSFFNAPHCALPLQQRATSRCCRARSPQLRARRRTRAWTCRARTCGSASTRSARRWSSPRPDGEARGAAACSSAGRSESRSQLINES